jgi:hypothetical protein
VKPESLRQFKLIGEKEDTHDTARKIEITVDMLIHINNERSNQGVDQNGEEDCCDHRFSTCCLSWSPKTYLGGLNPSRI